jgi:hypothetical protein
MEEVVLQAHDAPATWLDAQERHQRLYGDVVRDLQFD